MVSQSLISYNNLGSSIKGGTATASGNGVATTFLIAHNLGEVPSTVTVEDATADSFGARTVSKDANNITLVYSVPPPDGTNNLSWIWSALKVN